MKLRREYKETTNSHVYNRAHKEAHASCSYCGWNRCENRKSKLSINWKQFRKTKYK